MVNGQQRLGVSRECKVLCNIHKQECPVFSGDAVWSVLDPEDEIEDSDSFSSEVRPLSIALAGVTCKAWSAAGAQFRFSHSSEAPLAAWLAERRVRAERLQEDIAFVECTPRFPAEVKVGKRSELSDTHDMVSICNGPEGMGFPALRGRFAGAVLNRQTVVWTGPRGVDLVRDFRLRFWKTLRMPGSALLCDDEQSRLDYYMELMDGKIDKTTFLEMVPWEQMTFLGPPGMNQRFSEWQLHCTDTHYKQENEGYLCDLDHHPRTKRSCSGGRVFPTLLTHGTVCSIDGPHSWRLATPTERFVSLGFHCLPDTCHDHPQSRLMRVISSAGLTQRQIEQITGNGMHLQAQACWMVYVLANTKRVDWACSINHGLPPAEPEWEWGEPDSPAAVQIQHTEPRQDEHGAFIDESPAGVDITDVVYNHDELGPDRQISD